MNFTVYILYSPTSQKHYTGFTSNLEERLLSHNYLGRGWTKKYRPWMLVQLTIFICFRTFFNSNKIFELTNVKKLL